MQRWQKRETAESLFFPLQIAAFLIGGQLLLSAYEKDSVTSFSKLIRWLIVGWTYGNLATIGVYWFFGMKIMQLNTPVEDLLVWIFIGVLPYIIMRAFAYVIFGVKK